MNANHYIYQEYSIFLEKRQNHLIKFKTGFRFIPHFVNKCCMVLLLGSLKYPLVKPLEHLLFSK